MKRSINIKQVRFYLWVALGYFFVGILTTWHTYSDRSFAVVFNNIWGVIYLLVINFTLFEYSVPFILKKRKQVIYNILLAILIAWIYMMLYSYAAYVWRKFGIALHIYTPLKIFPTLSAALENQMGYSVASVFFFGIIRHVYNYLKLKNATQLLRIEKQTAELNYLKSQTNPHFLFNTLNNIYSLARDKNDLAPESILRLSKILRFMLYETGGEYIAIEQELKIIHDYIDLEKLRYDDSLRVSFHNDIEDMKQALPPLLLMPLVENAFKHGVSETRGQPFVDIQLSIRKRQLVFSVKNSVDAFPADQPIKENIGLSNLRRQLQLLYKEHDLSVQQGVADFTATLKINLSSHA